jgi:putative methionine-R-sulfoxide reductase with GAF domain
VPREKRLPAVKNEIVSEDKNKPVFDEQTLGKLLQAAFVLQEHNREMRELELSLEMKRDLVEAQERASAEKSTSSNPEATSTAAPLDYTLTLGQIVEIQHHVQVHHLELESAMELVAKRVVEITRAAGAAVGMTDGENLCYHAVAGRLALARGTSVPLETSPCVSCLKTGQVLRCADLNPEFLLDTKECRRRGIESMIAVPIFHDGAVVGAMELYYSKPRAFSEQDVHTCRLMAGLITEALARAEEASWKKSLASERAAMMEALEKIHPDLAAIVSSSTPKEAAPITEAAAPVAAVPPAMQVRPASPAPEYCRKCGHEILGEEQFCGQCGSPRSGDYEPATMQSKVAALWQMQEAKKKEPTDAIRIVPAADESPSAAEAAHLAQSLAHLEKVLPDLFEDEDVFRQHPEETVEVKAELLSPGGSEEMGHDLEISPVVSRKETFPEVASQLDPAELPKPPEVQPETWRSAASARLFFEQLASNRTPSLVRFWNTRRGDIYLAVAVILVLCVIRWGMWSGRSVTAAPNAAAAQHHKSPENDLSLLDRMLIQFGLAEPPETPVDKGDPSIPVWVDTRTALYYCPGTDLYQKTPKGKLETQREAQLDQFQPAYRQACN